MPDLKSFKNSHGLSIISFVSRFKWNHFFKKVDYQIQLAKIGLQQILNRFLN